MENDSKPIHPHTSAARGALERVLNSANHGLASHGVRRSLGDLDGMEDAAILRRVLDALEEMMDGAEVQSESLNHLDIWVRKEAWYALRGEETT